jgi:hypothetical protein
VYIAILEIWSMSFSAARPGSSNGKIIFVPTENLTHMIRAMQPVGTGLEKIVGSSLRRSPAGQGPLLAWALACGHAVAARTRAIDFAQGILRVEVPDAGWRAELRALAPQYLAVMNRYVAESVKRIEFVIVDKTAGDGVRVTRV